jgi:hypothetical protein
MPGSDRVKARYTILIAISALDVYNIISFLSSDASESSNASGALCSRNTDMRI